MQTNEDQKLFHNQTLIHLSIQHVLLLLLKNIFIHYLYSPTSAKHYFQKYLALLLVVQLITHICLLQVMIVEQGGKNTNRSSLWFSLL